MAYIVHEPTTPQEHAQLAHGSGARVQDHDPDPRNQPASPDNSTVGPLAQVMVAAEQIPSQSAAQQSSKPLPVFRTPREHLVVVLKRCWRMPRLVTPFGKEDTAAELQSHAARTQDTLVNAVENAEVTDAVFRALTRLRAAELKEFDTIARLETQIINETFRRETVSHEFKTAPVAGAYDEEERQGCQERWCGERDSMSR